MKTKYQLSYYLRIAITVVAYIIFFGYIIYSIINVTTTQSKIFNIIIGIFVGGTGLIFEVGRIIYDLATKKLIFDIKPNEVLTLLDKVNKVDIFKRYDTSSQMMRMLAMIDLRDYENLKTYINELEKEEITNYDVAITAKYSLMMAYGETGNKGKSNEAFKQLVSLRDEKVKGKRHKGAFFFNWEVVNGQHKNYDHEYESALRYLSDVNESNMNKREVMHYLLAKLVAAKNTNSTEIYNNCKNRLYKILKDNNKIMSDYVNSI